MALLTYAQGAQYFSRLNINSTFGMLYFDASPIFRMFPINVVPPGQLRVNYTDGATAGTLGTGAGIPNTSGAPAKVDDTETKVFAAIASQAQIDQPTKAQGNATLQAQQSMDNAVAAIYREFVGELVGTYDGETYGQLWGVKDYLSVTQETDAMTVSGSYAVGNFTSALLREDIGKMIAKLPQDGSPNLCLTSPDGYEAVYKAIEAHGGTTPQHTVQDTFGFSNLIYRNTIFFATDKVSSWAPDGSPGDIGTDYFFYNLGPNGVKLCVPDSLPVIDALGPARTVGYAAWVWDVILNAQVLYTGHHSAGRLMTFCHT